MWHFMNRQIQKERVDPVSSGISSLNPLHTRSELIMILHNHSLIPQLENARAVIDLYRSIRIDCEGIIAGGEWPFFLPPDNFARCYL
jgi:hypothetical protein